MTTPACFLGLFAWNAFFFSSHLLWGNVCPCHWGVFLVFSKKLNPVYLFLVSSYCCSSYWAANPFSSLGPFSSSFIGDPMLSPMKGCEHSLLDLSGTGRASQETAISGSYQKNLVGICNSVWIWYLYMGWIPRWGSQFKIPVGGDTETKCRAAL